jgi:hypothetical protein
MIGLDQATSSYAIISSSRIDEMESILYGREYSIVPIKEFYQGSYIDSIITTGRVDNDNLRQDILFLLNKFNHNFAIIKYLGESVIRKIFKDGSEVLVDMTLYNTDFDKASYIYNGYSFSFTEKKRYFFLTKKEEIKAGMVLEFFNNNKWVEKQVSNPDLEYDKLYKLLMKYKKVRIPV